MLGIGCRIRRVFFNQGPVFNVKSLSLSFLFPSDFQCPKIKCFDNHSNLSHFQFKKGNVLDKDSAS